MTKSYVKVQRKIEKDAHEALKSPEPEKSVDTNSAPEVKEKKVTKKSKKNDN